MKNCVVNVVFLKKLILNKKKKQANNGSIDYFYGFFNVDYLYVYVILSLIILKEKLENII